jgi:hypothetical protein
MVASGLIMFSVARKPSAARHAPTAKRAGRVQRVKTNQANVIASQIMKTWT